MKPLHQLFLEVAIILGAVLSPLALAQSAVAPPLKPNEKVVTTKDGCGLVIDGSTSYAAHESARISKLTWGGPCVGGLAMGEGWFHEGDYRYLSLMPMRGWAWYGRIIGVIEHRIENGASFSVRSTGFTWDGRNVSYTTLSTSNPIWGNPDEPGKRGSSVKDGDILIVTSHRPCLLERKTFPECEHESKFHIPGVMVFNLQARTNQFHSCPNPRSTQGCEALWAQHAGPVIENIKAFIAENKPKVEALKREVAPLIAHWRPSPTARRDDAARHAAIRTEHLAERRKQEEKLAEMRRNTAKLNAETEKLRAENAVRQAENEKLRVASEQERKERNRRDRQEAMGVLRSYSSTAASMGNNKPTRQLAVVEILAGNTPQEILSILRTALTEAAARSPALARKLSTLSWPQDISAQDALALLRPVLMDAAGRNPNVAKKLAILEALTASAPQEAMDILKPMLADAVNKRLMR